MLPTWVSVSSQSVRHASPIQRDLSDLTRFASPDTGAEKRDLVMKLGAEKWIDFKETKDLVKDIKDATDGRGPHVAVVTAATSKAYEQAIDYLRPGGNLMVVGLPARASLNADIFFTVIKSINIIGSYVGYVLPFNFSDFHGLTHYIVTARMPVRLWTSLLVARLSASSSSSPCLRSRRPTTVSRRARL